MELIWTSEFFKNLKLHEPLRMRKPNMKKFAQKNCRKMFLEAIFLHSRKLFSEFPYKVFDTALHDIIGLQNFSPSFCQSISRITMCNLHWCYTFCTFFNLRVLRGKISSTFLRIQQAKGSQSCADLVFCFILGYKICSQSVHCYYLLFFAAIAVLIKKNTR